MIARKVLNGSVRIVPGVVVVDTRKSEEVAFHDRLREGSWDQRWSLEAESRLGNDPLWSNLKFYSIEQKSIDYMRNWLKNNCTGRTILDYGCGNGEESIYAARNGAGEVVGIDISPVAIENSRTRAANEGLQTTAHFQVTDGEALEFPDNFFDIAMEYGVLHHVNLHAAMSQLSRVLKPDGKMICTETLGHNVAIRLYRKWTPHLRTKWESEHILKRNDFQTIAKYFDGIEMRFFHLLALGAVPFRKLPVFSVVLKTLEALDDVLLRLPILKWHAWQTVFILSKPRKSLPGA